MIEIKQAEGLCHMWYRCNKCKTLERIWNSRPRVTPFTIDCDIEGCVGHMVHVKWDQDEYDPNYLPEFGDRIFVDWSKEAAVLDYYAYIEENWKKGENDIPGLNSSFKTKEEAHEHFISDWKFGQPTIYKLLEGESWAEEEEGENE